MNKRFTLLLTMAALVLAISLSAKQFARKFPQGKIHATMLRSTRPQAMPQLKQKAAAATGEVKDEHGIIVSPHSRPTATSALPSRHTSPHPVSSTSGRASSSPRATYWSSTTCASARMATTPYTRLTKTARPTANSTPSTAAASPANDSPRASTSAGTIRLP